MPVHYCFCVKDAFQRRTRQASQYTQADTTHTYTYKGVRTCVCACKYYLTTFWPGLQLVAQWPQKPSCSCDPPATAIAAITPPTYCKCVCQCACMCVCVCERVCLSTCQVAAIVVVVAVVVVAGTRCRRHRVHFHFDSHVRDQADCMRVGMCVCMCMFVAVCQLHFTFCTLQFAVCIAGCINQNVE